MVKKMANRYHSERITFLVHPEDRKFLDNYCENNQKSKSMIFRDYIKKLKNEILAKT